MISQGHLAKVRSYIELGSERRRDARVRRPRCARPARRHAAKGNFIQPTVFVDVDNRMRIAQEEIFGPVACLIPFDDEADAISLSNDIAYGLSSYIWTESTGRALRVAAAIEAGMCFVNSQNVRDLRQPFGGTKASGVGREGGTWSYEVFLEPKNVCVSLGSHHIPQLGPEKLIIARSASRLARHRIKRLDDGQTLVRQRKSLMSRRCIFPNSTVPIRARRQPAIDGHLEIARRCRELGVDTIVVFDVHWLVNSEYHINCAPNFEGVYTSNELPHFIKNMPYEYPGQCRSSADLFARMSPTKWASKSARTAIDHAQPRIRHAGAACAI